MFLEASRKSTYFRRHMAGDTNSFTEFFKNSQQYMQRLLLSMWNESFKGKPTTLQKLLKFARNFILQSMSLWGITELLGWSWHGSLRSELDVLIHTRGTFFSYLLQNVWNHLQYSMLHYHNILHFPAIHSSTFAISGVRTPMLWYQERLPNTLDLTTEISSSG